MHTVGHARTALSRQWQHAGSRVCRGCHKAVPARTGPQLPICVSSRPSLEAEQGADGSKNKQEQCHEPNQHETPNHHAAAEQSSDEMPNVLIPKIILQA